jgi:putative pyrroloquinoline-quinone binding quinoprotein
MATQPKTLQRSQIWDSRRYWPLIHAVILSATASSLALGAPKSARVLALNKTNGIPLASAWLWRTEDAAAGAGVVAGDALYFIEDRQILKSLELRTGKLQWETKLAEPVANTPVVGVGVVLVYSRDHLWAYATTSGRKMWDAAPPAQNGTPGQNVTWSLSETERPVIGEGKVFLCSNRRVVGLDAGNGTLVWSYTDVLIRERQTPIVERDRLYLRTTDAEMPWACLSTEAGLFMSDNGETLRRETPHPAPETKPSASRIAISPDRRMLTLTARRSSWKYQAPAPFTIAGIIGETPNAVCIQIVETPSAAVGMKK